MINLRPGKQTKHLIVGDIVYFATPQHGKDLFVVTDADVDLEKEAMLLGLWKFTGGYDHYNVHLILAGIQLNEVIETVVPTKKQGKIMAINSYRSRTSEYPPKEEFYFDTYAQKTSKTKTGNFVIPYEVIVSIEGNEHEYIIPAYSPIQHPFPLEPPLIGKTVEVWFAKGQSSIMKILD